MVERLVDRLVVLTAEMKAAMTAEHLVVNLAENSVVLLVAMMADQKAEN